MCRNHHGNLCPIRTQAVGFVVGSCCGAPRRRPSFGNEFSDSVFKVRSVERVSLGTAIDYHGLGILSLSSKTTIVVDKDNTLHLLLSPKTTPSAIQTTVVSEDNAFGHTTAVISEDNTFGHTTTVVSKGNAFGPATAVVSKDNAFGPATAVVSEDNKKAMPLDEARH